MTSPNRPSPTETANSLWQERFSDAEVLFLAGSVVRGEGTPHSDLDIVVVYKKVSTAYRDSFFYQGWPIEVFIHDPETLQYFFDETDGKTGIPALASMVSEGIEVPQTSEFALAVKASAKSVLEAGPKALSAEDIKRHRYMITDLCDDLRCPGTPEEALATGTVLYQTLADFFFRSKNMWSAKRKNIPKRLKIVDPLFAKQFNAAFQKLFANNDSTPILSLAETLLQPYGGYMFEGYRLDAPATWRTPSALTNL